MRRRDRQVRRSLTAARRLLTLLRRSLTAARRLLTLLRQSLTAARRLLIPRLPLSLRRHPQRRNRIIREDRAITTSHRHRHRQLSQTLRQSRPITVDHRASPRIRVHSRRRRKELLSRDVKRRSLDTILNLPL